MGDRTSVTLTVLTEQAAAAEELFNEEADESQEYEETTSYIFSEMNYGTLDFLPDLLAAGIAYNSSWDDGDDYPSGTEYTRFTPDGGVLKNSVYDNAINPNLNELICLIDQPTKLKQFILNHKDKVTPLNLDAAQISYGKLYRTCQLIGLINPVNT